MWSRSVQSCTERVFFDPLGDAIRASPSTRTGTTSYKRLLKNGILAQLSDDIRDALLADADRVRLPVGSTFARVGDAVSAAYFPERGLVSVVSEMTTGHQVAVATVGAEGVFGLGSLFRVPQYPHRMIVLVESDGYRVPSDRIRQVFEDSDPFRRALLNHFATRISELMIAVACHRVHSNRQRLARWLLVTVDKAEQPSLDMTHEMLAVMVGGPRHAVTLALNELRVKGGLTHLRGRIEVADASVLRQETCECYDLLRALRTGPRD